MLGPSTHRALSMPHSFTVVFAIRTAFLHSKERYIIELVLGRIPRKSAARAATNLYTFLFVNFGRECKVKRSTPRITLPTLSVILEYEIIVIRSQNHAGWNELDE